MNETVDYFNIVVRDDMDDDTKAFAEMLNVLSKQQSVMAAQMRDIYEVFSQLKPLMGAMPKMPSGIAIPPGVRLPGMR